MITEILPCDKEEAILLLEDVEEWLSSRARFTTILGGIVLLISIIFSISGPVELRVMGIFSTILLVIVILWVYKGNRDLEAKVRDFKTGLQQGVLNLEDYCDIAVVTAVVAYYLKRTGRYAPGKSEGKRGRPGKS
ncbi:MAG: hypothetical protein F7C37_01220 [Desulfurococcales archaeon]|nr:hypothetical protein [Desulfurococcales archaeon]